MYTVPLRSLTRVFARYSSARTASSLLVSPTPGIVDPWHNDSIGTCGIGEVEANPVLPRPSKDWTLQGGKMIPPTEPVSHKSILDVRTDGVPPGADCSLPFSR